MSKAPLMMAKRSLDDMISSGELRSEPKRPEQRNNEPKRPRGESSNYRREATIKMEVPVRHYHQQQYQQHQPRGGVGRGQGKQQRQRVRDLLSEGEQQLAFILTPLATHHRHKRGNAVKLCLNYLSALGCDAGDRCPRAHVDEWDYSTLSEPVLMFLASLGGYPRDQRWSRSMVEDSVSMFRDQYRARIDDIRQQAVASAGGYDRLHWVVRQLFEEHQAASPVRSGGLKIIITNDRARSPPRPQQQQQAEEEYEEEAEEEEEDEVGLADGLDFGLDDEAMTMDDDDEMAAMTTQQALSSSSVAAMMPARRPSPVLSMDPAELMAAQRTLASVPEGVVLCWDGIAQKGCATPGCPRYHLPRQHWRGPLSHAAKNVLFRLGGINPAWDRSAPALPLAAPSIKRELSPGQLPSWVPASVAERGGLTALGQQRASGGGLAVGADILLASSSRSSSSKAAARGADTRWAEEEEEQVVTMTGPLGSLAGGGQGGAFSAYEPPPSPQGPRTLPCSPLCAPPPTCLSPPLPYTTPEDDDTPALLVSPPKSRQAAPPPRARSRSPDYAAQLQQPPSSSPDYAALARGAAGGGRQPPPPSPPQRGSSRRRSRSAEARGRQQGGARDRERSSSRGRSSRRSQEPRGRSPPPPPSSRPLVEGRERARSRERGHSSDRRRSRSRGRTGGRSEERRRRRSSSRPGREHDSRSRGRSQSRGGGREAAELEQLRAERDRLAAALAAKAVKLKAASEQVDEAKAAHQAAAAQLQSVEQEMGEVKAALSKVHELVLPVQMHVVQLQETVAERDEQLARRDERIRELEGQVEEEAARAAQLEERHDREPYDRRASEGAMRKLQRQLEGETKDAAELRARVEELTRRDKEWVQRYEKMQGRLVADKEEELQQARGQWSAGVQAMAGELEGHVERVGALRRALDAMLHLLAKAQQQQQAEHRATTGSAALLAAVTSGGASSSRHSQADSKPAASSSSSMAGSTRSNDGDSSSDRGQQAMSRGGGRPGGGVSEEVSRDKAMRSLRQEVDRLGRYRQQLHDKLAELEAAAIQATAALASRPAARAQPADKPQHALGGKRDDEMMAVGGSAAVALFDDDDEEALDVEDFNAKGLMWRGHVHRIKTLAQNRAKKAGGNKNMQRYLRLVNVSREDVVTPLLNKMAGVKYDFFFLELKVAKLEDEVATDEGGVMVEVFSLFFEQLPALTRRYWLQGEERSFQLFEMTGGGKVYLPRSLEHYSSEEADAIRSSAEVGQAYRCVGKVLLKAVIDGVPVPSCFASDFLLCWMVMEEPTQARVKLSLLSRMLRVMEPDYEWALPHNLVKAKHHPLTVADLLGSSDDDDDDSKGGGHDDRRPISEANVEEVFRAFFDQRIVRGRRWALHKLREPLQGGEHGGGNADMANTLVGTALAMFTPAQRRILVVGEEDFDGPKVAAMLLFRAWPKDLLHYQDAFASAVACLTPQQAQQLWRAATSWTAIPLLVEDYASYRCLYVEPKRTLEAYPTFSTCYKTIYVPVADALYGPDQSLQEQMRQRLVEAIAPGNGSFQELGSY